MSFEHRLDRSMGAVSGQSYSDEDAVDTSADDAHTTLWNAPYHPGPLDACVHIPGSKSLTNRALVLALLAKEPSTITGALMSRDTQLMMDAIEELGATCDVDGTTITVTPPETLTPRHGTINCGLAGTVMRFLPPVAMFATDPVRFDGDGQAYDRPMRPLLDAMESLGATITYEGEDGHLPFTVTPPAAPTGGKVTIDSHLSSQFVSALVMVGHRFPNGLQVHLSGRMPSPAHVDMTVAELQRRGGMIELESLPALIPGQPPAVHSWHMLPGDLHGGTFDIEPDLTNAGPFLAATLICGGQVRIDNWPAHTTQVGDLWRKIIPGMGGRIGREKADSLVARGTGLVGGLDINLSDGGELAPMVAALAAVAVNPSTITGIGHLAGHETNRLTAIANEVEAIGSHAQATKRTLSISPGATHGADLKTYNDHRMVMFAALVSLAVPGVRVRNAETVSKTFPGFIDAWEAMCATGPDYVPPQQRSTTGD